MINDFLSTLLQAILVAAVPVCATFIGIGLKALAKYLGEKTDSGIAQKFLDAVADAVSTAVTFTSQKYVDELKKSGKFTKENQEYALKIAKFEAMRLLTQETKDFIANAYGSLDQYLEGHIEAEVRRQKMGVGTLIVEN